MRRGLNPHFCGGRSTPTSYLRPADVAFDPERNPPGRAIGVEQRRGEVGIAGGKIGGVTTEGRRELRRFGGELRLVQGDELAAADHGTPVDKHGLDRPPGFGKNNLARRAVERNESRLIKIENHEVGRHVGLERANLVTEPNGARA